MKENIILDEKAKETFSTGISYYTTGNGNARNKEVCRHQWRLELVLIQLELSKV